jgi:hypothetical protein
MKAVPLNVGNDDLRWEIDEAKRRLPLPSLMQRLRLGAHAKKSARCPFHGHDDKHPSFSVFQGEDGFWHYNCFSKCGEGDEIMFLRKLKGLSMTKAMSLYLEMAGFPPDHSPKSREYPKCPESPEYLKCLEYHKSPECPVYPVSNGQGLAENQLNRELKGLAARCACRASDVAERRRFELARGVKALEKQRGRKLTTGEQMLTFNAWYRASGWYLDPKTRDDHLASYLAELGKVRVPTGEGDTLKKALEHVSKLSVSELPVIPDYAEAQERWRRIAALHRELSRRSTNKNKTYFLSCRDAAKAYPGLSHQTANDINLALAELGVVKIIRIGDKRLGGKASEFRYLLAQTENGASQTEDATHKASLPNQKPVASSW